MSYRRWKSILAGVGVGCISLGIALWVAPPDEFIRIASLLYVGLTILVRIGIPKQHVSETKKREKINLLSISLDKNILHQTDNDAQRRQLAYASKCQHMVVIVLTTKKDHHKHQVPMYFRQDNLEVFATGSTWKPLAIFDAVRIISLLDRYHSFDVVTSQDPIATGLIGCLSKLKFAIPLNLQLHSEFILSREWLRESWLHSFLKPLITWELHQADSIRVDNKQKMSMLRRRFPKITSHIFAAPMAIESKYFWKQVKPKNKYTKFISVGRLAPEKNFPLLINAFSLVHAKHQTVTLTIVGGGKEEVNIRKQIESLGLQKVVHLTGALPRDQVKKELHVHDVFVLASNYEGWGLVFAEAMAAGLPIICTKVSSTGELVKNGYNGIVVPINHKNSLAQAMISLITKPKQAAELAHHGQQYITDFFNPQKLISQWIDGLYATRKT